MKRIGYSHPMHAAVCALALTFALVSTAHATPNANGAVMNPRIFNDCPGTTLLQSNTYPALVTFDDANYTCIGGANLHCWTLSADGGATEAVFSNPDAFKLSTDMIVSGGAGEAGLRICPWFSHYADGHFNVRTTDGEIACFGGRLPFWSFTDPAHGGLHYVAGQPIHLAVTYLPHNLNAGAPATLQYDLVYGGNPYTSGPLPFDEGNIIEEPVHGGWGILDDVRVGGYVQIFNQGGDTNQIHAQWGDIVYQNLDSTPTTQSTWGRIKTLYR